MNRLVHQFTKWPLFALLFGVFISFAQSADDPSIERMKKDLFFLASDDCEGRGVETQGINKAADFIADRFRKLGLKAPKSDDYFQPFVIKGVASLGTKNRLVLQGPLNQQIEPTIQKQYSVSGLTEQGKGHSGLVFAGYGITTENKKYDDYAGIDAKGKIVIVLRRTPRTNAKSGAEFPEADTYSTLIEKVRNASEHKVGGLIFVNDSDTAGKTDDLMTFDYARAGGESASFPVIHIRRSLCDQILASEGKTLKEIESDIDREMKPQSFEIKGWQALIETSIKRQEIQARNVIGILEGKGPLAQETVIIGAHYDHLGKGERGSLAKGNKAIHHGADDNASGTTGLLELAQRLVSKKDREGRRIVFMAFSGEERGLIGSRHYVKEPILPLSETAVMINLDMIGRASPDKETKKDKLEIGGVGSAKGFTELVDKMNQKYGFELKKTKSGMGPSDHASFYPKGVPVFFYFTGIHTDYHKPSDTPEKINYDGMKKIVDMVEELTLDMASTKQRPEYLKDATESKRPGGTGSGSMRIPRIGFAPGEYDDDETRGVPVGSVSKDGPAEKAGMKAGDWIVEVGGTPVKNMGNYMTALGKARRGQVLEISVLRDGKKVQLKVTPE